MTHSSSLRRALPGKVADILIYIFCIALIIACLYPFYYVLMYSLSEPKQAPGRVFLWPVWFSLKTYAGIFKLNDIPSAFMVSVARSVLGTVITILCSSFFAFLTTKREMLFRRVVYRVVVISMYINAGLIPWYLTMRAYGLRNSFLLYILPGAVTAYYVILLKTFMEQLPKELEESATIDGAGLGTTFFRIIFPLSKPIVATVGVYSLVGQWNQWTDNYFLVTDERLQTLQMVLYNYLNQASRMQNMTSSAIDPSALVSSITPTAVKMCITIIAVLPILFVYPFLQRYFVKGIMIGAVKG